MLATELFVSEIVDKLVQLAWLSRNGFQVHIYIFGKEKFLKSWH